MWEHTSQFRPLNSVFESISVRATQHKPVCAMCSRCAFGCIWKMDYKWKRTKMPIFRILLLFSLVFVPLDMPNALCHLSKKKKKEERHVVYVCGCYSAIHCAIVTRHSAKTDINFRIFKANTHKTVTWRPNSRISVSALDEQTNRHAATQVTLSKVVKLNSC